MNRRELLGAALATAALSAHARAQQRRMPVVGFLNSQSSAGWEHFVAAFEKGLGEGGFVVGENVVIEQRWAEGRFERLPALAQELAARQVAVLVSTGGPDAALAAKAATTTIPIVFTVGPDPVRLGLVASLPQPGGNMTGFTLFTRQLGPKRLEVLRDLVPELALVAALFNPANSGSVGQIPDLKEGAEMLRLRLLIFEAQREEEFEAVFARIGASGVNGLFVSSEPYFMAHRAKVTALAARHRLPAIYESRELVEAGGLVSYGVNFADIYRQAGLYAARILKGEKPADLPVQQPARFELVLNLKAARAIGLTVPPAFEVRADEVIE